jgi:clan AA aspartic protease
MGADRLVRSRDATMIRGQVNAAKQALIPLQLCGSERQTITVDAVVDTGFDGLLTLPPDLVARLGLPFGMTRSYELGDGGKVAFDIHRTTVLWDGQEREVEAIVTSGGALVGMAMLRGYRLFVDVVDGGEVLIEARP